MTHPIPDAALDDRLGFLGTSGSGKTYNAGVAVERLLARKARVVIVDPLGVWWGLRLLADGVTQSPFNVAIFGGPHGDLPLSEHAGTLIGETAATMAESCIVDLSQLGIKSAERAFMVAFLETLYRRASGEPFHLIVDEADLFAPQKPPKGDETLLNRMEQIVRRGRVKGFIPWLISQRPAVLNKNVLSQVDGLVAFKLTATQDRDALDAWIEGQADKAQGKEIKDSLPTKQIGEGVVWIPGRGILSAARFPQKVTFDSSRTPKRGEKIHHRGLKPLDLGALKERLATVEQEIKANDPKALKAEIARLTRELQKVQQNITGNITADPKALEEAEKRGYQQGEFAGRKRAAGAIGKIAADLAASLGRAKTAAEDGELLLGSFATFMESQAEALPPTSISTVVPSHNTSSAPTRQKTVPPCSGLTGSQYKIIEALAFWQSQGFPASSRAQVAAAAGYSTGSGGFNNLLGSLRTAGMLDYPSGGMVALTDAGMDAAPSPDPMSPRQRLDSVLSTPQARVLDALADGQTVSRDELGRRSGYQPSSGGFNNLVGSLRTLGLIKYPSRRMVAVEPWVFQ